MSFDPLSLNQNNSKGNLAMILVFLCCNVFAQQGNIAVDARLDTNQMLIGEQVHLDLSISFPKGLQVAFPLFTDSLNSMEIVEKTKVDTSVSEDGKISTLSQKLSITAFDAGLYVVGPFKYYYRKDAQSDTDSLLTDLLTIKVETVAVDTTQVFKEIKAPLDAPFSLSEIAEYLIIGGIILLVLIAVLWYLKRKRKKSGIIQAPRRPAHEKALEELQHLQEQNIWQQGFYKHYQSSVSDIIRTYVEERFLVPAMELTTDETLNHLRGKILSGDNFEKLQYILQLADTVKFAKAHPLPTENELSMQHAIHFVMATKSASVDASESETGNKQEGLA